MKAMGIDIGTTTACGIVLDTDTGEVLDVRTLQNNSVILGEPYEWLQDPERIWELVQQMYREFTGKYSDIGSIGLTGQMHGIVYTDASGQAVGPLYTWQDERGNQQMEDGRTYAEYLSGQTGYPMATGFGVTTHFYNVRRGLVPEGAVSMCTIHDYMAMKLTGRDRPLLTASDGASLGCFNLEKLCFDGDAVARAGLDSDILPQCESGFVIVGRTPEGIPVGAGIGDNQASVIGSVRDLNDSVLVNVGTANQISVGIDRYIDTRRIDIRPLAGGTYICAGAGLCGGRAYAALEKFLRGVVETMTGRKSEVLYERMGALLDQRGMKPGTLTVDTRFCGTRENPELTGSIQNLTLENFQPSELIYGVLGGIVEELASFHKIMLELGAPKPEYLIGSGNAIRMNRHLKAVFEDVFGMKMQIPVHREEAAFGAALYAMTASGICSSLEDAQKRISYEMQQDADNS